MAEELLIIGADKEANYKSLIPQLKALVGNETDLVANLANVCAALKETFGFFWVGFYWVKNEELVLAPFQGSIACTRIAFGRGVCGSAWEKEQSILVENVDEFPGHIACSSTSKSEIVVPIFKNKTVVGVLDVDSDVLNDFDAIDKKYLEEICAWISTFA